MALSLHSIRIHMRKIPKNFIIIISTCIGIHVHQHTFTCKVNWALMTAGEGYFCIGLSGLLRSAVCKLQGDVHTPHVALKEGISLAPWTLKTESSSGVIILRQHNSNELKLHRPNCHEFWSMFPTPSACTMASGGEGEDREREGEGEEDELEF